jgi:predicted nucleic acid-binding protein
VTLVDTSVWVQHLRGDNRRLRALLEEGDVLCHPFIVGELACGSIHNRDEVLGLLETLPQVAVADHDEVLNFLEQKRLFGRGVGWIDLHLLTSVFLSDALLWTVDRRLADAAAELGKGFPAEK